MTEILEEITDIVTEYKSSAYLTKDKLRELLRVLSTNYYFITTENVKVYQDWNNLIYNRDKRESVASAERRADEKYPELRQTRKMLEATKGVILSMQQELSILKSEDK